MSPRTPRWMTGDHQDFALLVRRFFAEQLVPNLEAYRKAGRVPKSVWDAAGELGILGASVPEAFGGSGLPRSIDAVTFLEQGAIGDTGWGFSVHNFVTHYVAAYGTEAQKQRWLPDLASGRRIAAIAMTEPGVGSDLKAVRATARREGGRYVLDGSKTFITNGHTADLFCVVAKTDPGAGARGVSLLMVDGDAPGFTRGRDLEKLGMKRADTAELFFEGVSVPEDHLLGGEEGRGFGQLMKQLSWERLVLAILGLGCCRRALELTLEYTREREVFGRSVLDFQNSRFKLAEAHTKTEVLAAFVDRCVEDFDQGQLTAEHAAMAKWWGSQVQCEVTDECLQLFGGYGYMMEYPIAELFADARGQKLYGGTNEIMKEIIGRGLSRS